MDCQSEILLPSLLIVLSITLGDYLRLAGRGKVEIVIRSQPGMYLVLSTCFLEDVSCMEPGFQTFKQKVFSKVVK